MHYRNGREAKNGDRVIQIGFDGKLQAGVIFDCIPGNYYCNGNLVPTHGFIGACLIDCINVDDILDLLKEKNLDKRPAGK
jgi:hypothetical protein